MNHIPWESIGTAISVILTVSKILASALKKANDALESIIEMKVAGIQRKLGELHHDQENTLSRISILAKHLEEIKTSQSVSKETLIQFHNELNTLSKNTENALNNLEKSRVEWINETIAVIRAAKKKES